MAFDESYFRQELDYLRQLGKMLAKEKPQLASFLAEKEADPDIERLLEGFSLLSGKLRQKIEDEFPEFTYSLINLLLPNYLRPVPSMTVIEYTPDVHNLTTEILIPRNETVLSASDKDHSFNNVFTHGNEEQDLSLSCTFTLCRDVWLLPVSISNVENHSSHKYGVIDITFAVNPNADLSKIDLNKLRFWLGNDDNYTRYQLYLWLNEYLLDAEILVNEQHIALPDFMPVPVGFEKQDTLLPWPKNTYSGYRILLEYFCFPEGFFFFDIKGIRPLPANLSASTFTLRLRFSRPLPLDIKLRNDSLRLFCTPAVNLFSHQAEPISLDETNREYPLRASRRFPDAYDIFSVCDVYSQSKESRRGSHKTKGDFSVSTRPELAQGVYHWPNFESYNHQAEYGQHNEVVYYHHRTKSSLFRKGMDHSLSFVHADGSQPESTLLKNETVSVSLLCTNRELPTHLRVGDINTATGKNAAVASLRNVTHPTQPLPPVENGKLHWALISSVSLNYFSLLDKNALVQVLRTYDRHGAGSPQKARLSQLKLDAIQRLETHPADSLFNGVPVRGLTSTLWIDPRPFTCAGEVYLLGSVLSHFFSLYASVNSFHELTVVNTENQETWEWQEKMGQHPLI